MEAGEGRGGNLIQNDEVAVVGDVEFTEGRHIGAKSKWDVPSSVGYNLEDLHLCEIGKQGYEMP